MQERLLLSELRLLRVTPRQAAPTDELMVLAMTANDELSALGYTLRPEDVVRLARCEELRDFPARVRELQGDVKAAPMYPGFPEQVLEMPEAVYRFHQMLHYFSTYGLERVTGEAVSKGWMPETEQTAASEPEEPPERLVELKVVALVDADKCVRTVLERILGKTERMTGAERDLIVSLLPELRREELEGLTVRFKENLNLLFCTVVTSRFAPKKMQLSGAQRLELLRGLCQHTGDVLKCITGLLGMQHYHLHTAEKRLMVKLLESYPAEDLRENLIRSAKYRGLALTALKFIDYNEYSRSGAHKQAVAALRAGELRSWESMAKERIAAHAADTLDFLAQRPGMLLRMVTTLLRNGYPAEEIGDALAAHAGAIRTQTLITMLNHFTAEPDPAVFKKAKEAAKFKQEAAAVEAVCMRVLEQNLAAKETLIRGKRIAFRFGDIAPEYSAILTNDKSGQGGYIPSGTAFRIPEHAHRIRFFVYWNDRRRVDVDLHAYVNVKSRSGEPLHIGWNASFRGGGVVMSGDITHSNAAEYIDIDLDKVGPLQVSLVIRLFFGADSFGDIDTCYVGCMAVEGMGGDVPLYDPKNCFFTHHLRGDAIAMQYGYIDLKRRCVSFTGNTENTRSGCGELTTSELYRKLHARFTMQKYFDLLVRAQGAELVPESEAERILVIGKPENDTELSLRDVNYFMD